MAEPAGAPRAGPPRTHLALRVGASELLIRLELTGGLLERPTCVEVPGLRPEVVGIGIIDGTAVPVYDLCRMSVWRGGASGDGDLLAVTLLGDEYLNALRVTSADVLEGTPVGRPAGEPPLPDDCIEGWYATRRGVRAVLSTRGLLRRLRADERSDPGS